MKIGQGSNFLQSQLQPLHSTKGDDEHVIDFEKLQQKFENFDFENEFEDFNFETKGENLEDGTLVTNPDKDLADRFDEYITQDKPLQSYLGAKKQLAENVEKINNICVLLQVLAKPLSFSDPLFENPMFNNPESHKKELKDNHQALVAENQALEIEIKEFEKNQLQDDQLEVINSSFKESFMHEPIKKGQPQNFMISDNGLLVGTKNGKSTMVNVSGPLMTELEIFQVADIPAALAKLSSSEREALTEKLVKNWTI